MTASNEDRVCTVCFTEFCKPPGWLVVDGIEDAIWINDREEFLSLLISTEEVPCHSCNPLSWFNSDLKEILV